MHGPVCAQCGQPRAERIAVRRLLGALRDCLVGLDFRLPRTVRGLFAGPGEMLRGYLAGRRIRYTNPLKLLFLSATLYLLVVTLLDLPLSFGREGQQTALSVVALINYLMFLFLVPTAWWLQVLFRRSGYNWAESYVVLCFFWSGYVLIGAALGAALVSVGDWYVEARSLAGLFYLTLGLRSFYRRGWWSTLWRTVLLFAGYFLSSALVMSLVISLAYLTGFEPLMLPFRGS